MLAAVRLGCNLDYDKLQDLAENHRALRAIMQVGEFDETNFSWKRIRDNVCLLRPETIDDINRLVVAQGHVLVSEAVKTMRADSFVIETDIHYPTDSSLIVDGIRKIVELSEPLAKSRGLSGWRQHAHPHQPHAEKPQPAGWDSAETQSGRSPHLRVANCQRPVIRSVT